MLIGEFTSVVQNSLNSLSLDDYLSEEYIYSVGISIAQLLIKREADTRKLFKNTALFQSLPCVEMITVPINECGYNFSCKTLQRSEKKLPTAYLTNFGSLLQVFNITKDLDYKEVSPMQYKEIRNQKYKPRGTKYFWLDNGYLYIPDSEVEVVTVSILSPEILAMAEISNSKGCISALENAFPVPDYMVSTVINETVSHIFNSKRINKDENPNMNVNEKSEVR